VLWPKRSPKSKPDDDILKFDPLCPGDPPRVIVTKDGTVARQETDGSLTVRQPDGSEFVVDAEGHGRGRLRTVASVTVVDIAYVTEHHINTIYDTVSHVVRFLNGGTLCYSIDGTGRLLDCEFSRIQVSLTDGHVVAGCTKVALAVKPELAGDGHGHD
jgi:hypothetical protein